MSFASIEEIQGRPRRERAPRRPLIARFRTLFAPVRRFFRAALSQL